MIRFSLVLVINIAFMLPLGAQTPTILHCLGREEEVFHRQKTRGPDYQLNNAMIEIFVELPQVSLLFHQQRVCQLSEKKSVAFKILDNLLTYGKEGIEPVNKKRDRLKIANTIFSHAPNWVMLYVSHSKLLYENPRCLYKRVAELNTLDSYLQSPAQLPSIRRVVEDRAFLQTILRNVYESNQNPECQLTEKK